LPHCPSTRTVCGTSASACRSASASPETQCPLRSCDASIMRCLHRSHYAMHPLITSCEASIALLMRCIHYSYHAMNPNLPSNTANHSNPWISGILSGQLLGSSDRYHASAASALKHQWFATDPKTASTDRSARAHHCSPRQRSPSIAVPAHVLIAVQAHVLRSKCRAPCGLTAVPRATRCSNRTSAPSPRRSSRPRRLAGDRALGSDAPRIFPRPTPTAAAPLWPDSPAMACPPPGATRF